MPEHLAGIGLDRLRGELRGMTRAGRFHCRMFRQSEVQDLDQAVFGEEQVLGLQIAVSNAFRVRRRQPARGLDGIIDGLANRQRGTCQPFSQRLTLQQLGGDVKHAALGAGHRR